jgi:hypothetical protein
MCLGATVFVLTHTHTEYLPSAQMPFSFGKLSLQLVIESLEIKFQTNTECHLLGCDTAVLHISSRRRLYVIRKLNNLENYTKS